MSFKGCIIFGIFMLVLGIVVTHKMAPEPEPAPALPPNKIETREVEKEIRVEVPVVPDSCTRAISLADELTRLVEKYEGYLGKEDAILADAYTAITGKNTNDLNKAIVRQRAVKGESLETLIQITDKRKLFDKALVDCQSDTPTR